MVSLSRLPPPTAVPSSTRSWTLPLHTLACRMSGRTSGASSTSTTSGRIARPHLRRPRARRGRSGLSPASLPRRLRPRLSGRVRQTRLPLSAPAPGRREGDSETRPAGRADSALAPLRGMPRSAKAETLPTKRTSRRRMRSASSFSARLPALRPPDRLPPQPPGRPLPEICPRRGGSTWTCHSVTATATELPSPWSSAC